MKPNFIKSGNENEASFSFRVDHNPGINSRWHYHQEYELVYFKKGSGTQYVGDSITRFSDGDVILIGPHLEHYWQFDEHYFQPGILHGAEAYVIHFERNFCGNTFFNLPECNDVLKLLETSKRGVQVGSAAPQIARCLTAMASAGNYERLALLISILGIIAGDISSRYLVSEGFTDASSHDDKRIQLIINYVSRNLQNNICLDDLSDIAAMNPTSLCRYFKARMNESISSFIEKMRVGHACKLISKGGMSIKQIAHEAGFGNLNSFHKSFKKLKGTTPLVFQQRISGRPTSLVHT